MNLGKLLNQHERLTGWVAGFIIGLIVGILLV